MGSRDLGLEMLLLLDGENFVVEANGSCWVKFVAIRVPPTLERPQGINYSLTLHDDEGARLLGFDNAHPIREGTGPGAQTRIEYDHKHAGERIRFYQYSDAVTLLEDFWAEVEAVLQRRSTQ